MDPNTKQIESDNRNERPAIQEQTNASWVGWLSVRESSRGQGIGKALLQHTIDTAQTDGKKFLRLYTSTHSRERAAQGLYDSMGVKVIRSERHPLPIPGLRTLDREIRLETRKTDLPYSQ